MKIMYKDFKFIMDLVWSNPIKIWFIAVSLYLGYETFTIDRYIISEIEQVKRLPDNKQYVLLKGEGKKWRMVDNPSDIRGGKYYQSTSGVFVLFWILLFFANLWFWGYIADSKQRGWDFYKLYLKHYPHVLNVYDFNSSIRLYTVKGYLCIYDYVRTDSEHKNAEAAIKYYFTHSNKIKYFDAKKNRLDTIKNIIND